MSEVENKSDREFKRTEEIVEGEPYCPFCGFEKLKKIVYPGLDDNDHYTQAQCGDCSACVEWSFWKRRAFVIDVKSALATATDYEQLMMLIETALAKYKLRRNNNERITRVG